MKNDFKLEDIGKRMPYSMPENFLAEMKRNVMLELNTTATAAADIAPTEAMPSKHSAHIFHLFRTAVAAAAVATLFVVCYKAKPFHPVENYGDVERAFDNLSYDDQALMLDTYSNDVFMTTDGYEF